MHERRILGTELLWAFGVGVLIAATLSMVVFTALTMGMNPPSNVREGTARPCRYPKKACPLIRGGYRFSERSCSTKKLERDHEIHRGLATPRSAIEPDGIRSLLRR
jgi:hypothetical protein